MSIVYDKIIFYKNQNVEFTNNEKCLKIVSKQNKSTPGIYFYVNIEYGKTYIFNLKYIIKSNKKIIKLWFTFENNVLIKTFDKKNKKEFNKMVISNLNTKIKIGILFVNPKMDDEILIKKITFQPNSLESEEQQTNKLIIDEKLYLDRIKNLPEERMYNLNLYLDKIRYIHQYKITVKWERSLSIPTAIEESFFNNINKNLIFSCGYNGGYRFSYKGNNNDSKVVAGKYTRSLKKTSYCLNLDSKYIWNKIEEFPGVERQGGRSVVYKDKMYCYGGYTFIPSKTHNPTVVFKEKKKCFQTLNDGYSISYNIELRRWIWSKLPDLPMAMSGIGMTMIDNYIYTCCGVHRDSLSTGCQLMIVKYNNTNNKSIDVGRKLFRLDVNNLDIGWEEYDIFPGTLRFNPAMTSIDDVIYIIGGIRPNHKWKISKKISDRYYNVTDNWKYNVVSKEWKKIENEIANNLSNWGLSNDKFVYENRYIILIGGYSYLNLVTDGKLYKNKYHNNNLSNKMFIYDTVLNVCYKTNNMFCRINVPDYVVTENKIYFIGGESEKYTFEYENYGRHSDVFAIGTITKIAVSFY
jgi:hypothetical protein